MPSEYDFGRMQEEAARRAREMQARARFPQASRPRSAQPPPVRESNGSQPGTRTGSQEREGHVGPQDPAPPVPVPQPAPEPGPPQPIQEAPTEAAPNGLLEALFKDKERTIILALLILLGSDGSNHELMFALMFLLM